MFPTPNSFEINSKKNDHMGPSNLIGPIMIKTKHELTQSTSQLQHHKLRHKQRIQTRIKCMTSPSTSNNNNPQCINLIPKSKTIRTLKQIHTQFLTTGLSHHTFPLSKLLLKSSTISISYTLSIFLRIPNPSIFLYNTLISSFVSTHQTHLAFSLYNQTLTSRFTRPNAFTYPSLFKACAFLPQHGKALHTHVLKFLNPVNHDRFLEAAIIGFYANCGELRVARSLFDRIHEPDLATWNTLLTAYANSGDNEEVLRLFMEMQRSVLVRANEVSLVALIQSFSEFRGGLCAHGYLIKNNLRLNQFIGTALIHLYSKCGRLGFARQVFDEMLEGDTSCYNAMIYGLGVHGFGKEAIGVYKDMISRGLVPDDVTFLVTMSACSYVGLVDEGLEIFHSMREVYSLEPKVEHYGCLVDLLGRSGRLKEAEECIEKMPMKPNATLLRSFLASAQIHGESKRGEIAQMHLLRLETENSGNYVLLSNIYAGISRWDQVAKTRELMKDHRVNKSPGLSTIQI